METIKRTVIAFSFFPLLIFAVFFTGIYQLIFFLLFAILSFLMVDEYIKIFRKRIYIPNRIFIRILSVLILIPFYLFLQGRVNQLEAYQLILALMISATLISFILLTGRNLFGGCSNAVFTSMFGILFITIPLGHLFFIRGLEYGAELIVFVLAITWMTDAFAYFTGKLIGKHKLNLPISPNKSVEGFAGAIFFGTISGWIFTLIFPKVFSELWIPVLLAFILSIITIFGDMAESLMKRDTGIKDSSTVIPGHGGLLDSFDSILFTVPLFYYLFTLFSRF